MRLQKISVTNSVERDTSSIDEGVSTAALALRYCGREGEEYSTSPRTITRDAPEVRDEGDTNTIYGTKPRITS